MCEALKKLQDQLKSERDMILAQLHMVNGGLRALEVLAEKKEEPQAEAKTEEVSHAE